MEPSVSIVTLTYRHAAYIEQCIEGALMQRTTFPVEILVGEDDSDDGTREICQRLAAEHPDRIKLFLRERKDVVHIMGIPTGRSNFLGLLASARGKYVALCEGDDYWTDPLKLQKQVDHLEAHPEDAVCFHQVLMMRTHEIGVPDKVFPTGLAKHEFTTEDVLAPWFIPTGSIVFRRPDPFVLPPWMGQVLSADIPLLLLLSLEGRFRFIEEVMGVYRIHQGGLSLRHNGYDKVRGMAHIYELFNAHTQFRFNDRVREAFIAEVKLHLPEVRELKAAQERVKVLEAQQAKDLPLSRKIYYFLWNHFPWMRRMWK
ncbi:MAG: glycosyltransferase family A protein [Flavobacteriales bacterium]